MADRFIRHGATYNGDGTTSAEATSNGGVGAWNTLTYFEGTTPAYGTLPAGTTVYIRSKNAAGADISFSVSAAVTFGNTAATSALPIIWVIDNGTVWPGVAGVITYTTTNQNTVTFLDYNHIICATDYSLVCLNSYASFSAVPYVVFGIVRSKGLKIDCAAHTVTHGAYHNIKKGGLHENMWVRSHNRHLNVFYSSEIQLLGGSVTFINPKIELLNPLELDPVFSTKGYFNNEPLTVFGGEVFGAGAVQGVCLIRNEVNTGGFRSFGLKFPRVVDLSSQALSNSGAEAYANGSDGILGNSFFGYFYAYDSRDDGYYPTLNATLETSAADAWSYKLYPYRTNYHQPARIVTSKLYTQAAGIKTVTLELLWPTGMAAPLSTDVQMMVQYTRDSDGAKVAQTTLAYPGTALATSTANWSATTYGPTLFSKKKLTLTTDSAIRQDTEVLVTLISSPLAASSNDVIFVCPDPLIA